MNNRNLQQPDVRSAHDVLLRRSLCVCAILAMPMLAAPALAQNFLVLFEQYPIPGTTLRAVSNAGGTLVANYGPIGVAIARSDNPSFATALRSTKGVRDVTPTSNAAIRVEDRIAVDEAADAAAKPLDPPTPAPGSDSLSGLQWNMDQISAPAARAINGGSRSIIV